MLYVPHNIQKLQGAVIEYNHIWASKLCIEHLLVFPSVVVVLERHRERDDGHRHPPAGHEVAQVGEHPVLGDDVGADGVHVDGLDHVEGEHGGEEEVDADRDVAARVLRGY